MPLEDPHLQYSLPASIHRGQARWRPTQPFWNRPLLSSACIVKIMPHCSRFAIQTTVLDFLRTRAMAGIRIASSRVMTAITTRSSIKVKLFPLRIIHLSIRIQICRSASLSMPAQLYHTDHACNPPICTQFCRRSLRRQLKAPRTHSASLGSIRRCSEPALTRVEGTGLGFSA